MFISIHLYKWYMCIPVLGQTKYFKIEKIISQEKQNQFLKKN